MNRVDRLLGYLLLFQSRGLMRAQDFAHQFEISERTVYRDVQALSEIGVPIVAIPGEGYRLMEGYYLPPIAFTPNEGRALHLAISMLTGITITGSTQSAARTALEKIRAVLSENTLKDVADLEAMLHFYAFPTPHLNFDDDRFITLQQAIRQQQVVELRYHAQHSNSVTVRHVEPVELICLERIWMLNAYCRLRQEARVFRLDRIDSLTITVEKFSKRELGDSRFLPRSLEVKIRFDAEIVRWVRERQHFSLVKDWGIDGNAATMIYRPRSFAQIEGWLLSWGDKLDVVEPAELRDRLATVARKIAERHRAKIPSQTSPS